MKQIERHTCVHVCRPVHKHLHWVYAFLKGQRMSGKSVTYGSVEANALALIGQCWLSQSRGEVTRKKKKNGKR